MTRFSKNQNKSGIIKISKAMRKSVLLIAVIFLAIGIANIKNSINTVIIDKDDQNIYQYNNKFFQNYTVNLKENSYIRQKDIPAGNHYVSDLISDIDMNMNYDYTGNEKLPITYSYKIDLIEKAYFTQDKETYEIINETINLKESEIFNENNDSFKINEKLNIDFAKYHNLIKSFKQEMGMNVDSKLCVVLTVNSSTEKNGKKISNNYSSNFTITLGNKIAIISGQDSENISKTEEINKLKETKKSINVILMIIGIIMAIVGISIAYWIIFKTQEMYSIKNNFKEEISRILKLCADRVVQVENEVTNGVENTVVVSSIDELIKLSDELYNPILYFINEEKEIATFTVLKDKVLYIYSLNKE